MRRRSAYGGVVFAATVALLAGACSATAGTKAGGGTAPVTLRMANAYAHLRYEPAVQDFVNRVQQDSGGKVRVEVAHEWGNFEPDAEQQVVKAVADGEVDLAWVGTRALDTLGVRSFRALDAPLLIDSYALQKKVVESEVPTRMIEDLNALDEPDVTGLAVLAGGLRKPISVKGPLLGPDDWKGLSIQTFRSGVHADTFRALGATPVQAGPWDRDAGLESGSIDGFENSLHIYAVNSMEHLAPHLALNVTLWPGLAILLANPDRLAALGPSGADRVRDAAADAAAHSTALVGTHEDALAIERCRSGAHFARASEAELAALRKAVEPVHRRLAEDPATKTYLADIRRLKASVPPETYPAVPSSCSGKTSDPAPPDEPVTNLDGTYRWTLTKDDARTHGTENEDLAYYPSTFTITLRDGEWAMKQTASQETGTGTYEVEGRRITFRWPDHPSIPLAFTRQARGDLRMRPVEPIDAGDRFVWSTRPWTKVG